MVLFLTKIEIPGNRPGVTMTIVSPIHSAAVIHQVGSTWTVATKEGISVNPEQLIARATR